MKKAEWYVDWFNSPYYHLLYNNRNDHEANAFINTLCDELNLAPGSKLWDLACGRGRHSIALSKKGFNVTGTDLSENNIREASASANDTLGFYVHDMRCPFRQNYFDAVMNLFTSIGYFTDLADNYLVFKHVAHALKPGGTFVIDFFNSEKVIACFNSSYTEKRGDIVFEITKKISANTIQKRIEFTDSGHDYYFEESVSLFKKVDFEKFCAPAGLRLNAVFGNYKLDPFDADTSDRLILLFKK